MIKKSKLLMLFLCLALTIVSVDFVAGEMTADAKDDGNIMYRLYNPNSGEHFYTADTGERDYLITVGWNYEGFGFIAASEGEPVYRLFNPVTGDHHYTLDSNEKDWLDRDMGWNYEGVGWYSRSTDDKCEKKMYRLFNPNALTATHHYTLSESERDYLVGVGWNDEGTSWTSAHTVESTTYTNSTCTQKGSSGFAQCSVCSIVFGNPAGIGIQDLPINPYNHEHIVYKPENQYVEVDGRQVTPLDACWYCLDCLKYTLDMVNWMYYE